MFNVRLNFTEGNTEGPLLITGYMNTVLFD